MAIGAAQQVRAYEFVSTAKAPASSLINFFIPFLTINNYVITFF